MRMAGPWLFAGESGNSTPVPATGIGYLSWNIAGKNIRRVFRALISINQLPMKWCG